MVNVSLEITCVHCLGTGKKKIYPIIDKNNLVARKGVLDEDLFLYRCPHCGHYQKIAYECIYYDEKLNYALLLGHDGNKLLKQTKLDLDGYQIRFVEEIHELKEKIIIIEERLDDRIIEIMKHDIRTSLASKATYNLILNQKLEFDLVYPDGEVIKSYPFSQHQYMITKDKYEGCLDNDYRIDQVYAAKKVLNLNKNVDMDIDYYR